jgi:hypothetical protein
MKCSRVTLLLGALATTAALGACAQQARSFGATEEEARSDASSAQPTSGEVDPDAAPSNDAAGTPRPDGGAGDSGSTGNDAGACVKISNACGVAPQCGCTSTDTCDLDSAGNAACVAAGLTAMGRACSSTTSCGRGMTCVFGTCRPFCAVADAGCGVQGTNVCTQVRLQDGGAIPNFKVCQVDCDLRDPNACGGTNGAGTAGCVHDGEGRTDCETMGTVPENQACSAQARCAPGLICVYPAAQPTNLRCKKWCRVGVNADCGGQTCTGFTTKAMVGSVEYGSCP